MGLSLPVDITSSYPMPLLNSSSLVRGMKKNASEQAIMFHSQGSGCCQAAFNSARGSRRMMSPPRPRMVSNGAAVTTPTAAKTTGGGSGDSSAKAGTGAMPVDVSSAFAPIFPVPECEGDGGDDDSGAVAAAPLFAIEDDNCPDSPVDVAAAIIAAVGAIS
mgnify:FL=1